MQSHQLDHMQTICSSLQTDNHANTSSLNFLQARCSYWCPTDSVKALKAHQCHRTCACSFITDKVHVASSPTNSPTERWRKYKNGEATEEKVWPALTYSSWKVLSRMANLVKAFSFSSSRESTCKPECICTTSNYTTTITTTVLQPLYRSTCVSRHLQ